ncbi:MAG: hypothetical protein ABJA35_17600 [Parafilimonas sp.]
MSRLVKENSKKSYRSDNPDKTKSSITANNNKPVPNKEIIQHLIHPDYILFDWEFFSRELEFE